MLAPEMKGAAQPLRDAGKSDPKKERLGGVLEITNTPEIIHSQRVKWLCSRYNVPPSVAVAVASLAFEVGATR